MKAKLRVLDQKGEGLMLERVWGLHDDKQTSKTQSSRSLDVSPDWDYKLCTGLRIENVLFGLGDRCDILLRPAATIEHIFSFRLNSTIPFSPLEGDVSVRGGGFTRVKKS